MEEKAWKRNKKTLKHNAQRQQRVLVQIGHF